ncbi:MAG TPA: pyridoxamine 5'-phosphate oxidase family protein [Smithellaceae bacterium]|nr:pyridoxamine 5'-phosphate oxidase family protein [Smithellaceae bacterium]HRS83536.1 pyridoxamine 5'-phosphate oxidase family protein [Smithellaceae bacterium]HRV45467.1 pyridoxamine 5'-phosphate oxidase family protein [Smithellaceae bacterium]
MIRSEKEIRDPRQIDAILQSAPVCRIAMSDGDQPYVVPVNFAVLDSHLYFHSGRAGRKIDILKINSSVCFEVDIPGELRRGQTACAWSMKYCSVIGFGRANFIEEAGDKKKALDLLLKKYSGQEFFVYDNEALDKVLVVGVSIEKMSGKISR